jgi:hypothetical protein
VCGLAAAAVIASAVHPEPGVISRLLSLRPLVWLGLISYGVYLYHWPIDVVIDEQRVGLSGWPLFAVQTAVTLAVAIASYLIVEQPIRRGALSGISWRKLTPAIAIGLVLVIVITTNGARPLRTVSPPSAPLAAATRAFRTAPPGATRVMIVGESVAYFLGASMATLHATPPLAVFNAGLEGCIFPPHITGARYYSIVNTHTVACGPSWEAGAVARFRPNIVFWIMNGPANAVRYRGRWLDSCSEQFASLYERSLREELATLATNGARVVMATEVYPRYPKPDHLSLVQRVADRASAPPDPNDDPNAYPSHNGRTRSRSGEALQHTRWPTEGLRL